MPTDMKKYPPDWKERRERILKRAKNRCESCFKKNHTIVHSVKLYDTGRREWFSDFESAREAAKQSGWNERALFPPRPIIKPVKVVLTIAHLDHDEHNWGVPDGRLMAMCQACHLKYDAKEKYRRVMIKNST